MIVSRNACNRVTKEIVSAVLDAQKCAVVDSVKVPGTEEHVRLLSGGRRWDMAGLSRVRRQFAAYTKNRGAASGAEDIPKLASMFVQYLNSTSAEAHDAE